MAAPGWRSAHRRCLAVLRYISTPDELAPSYRGNHSGSYRADQAASLRPCYLLEYGNMCFILTIRRLDFIWMDEEPDASIYSECLLRTASTSEHEKAGRMLITATPLLGLSEIIMNFLVDGRLVENNDKYATQIGWDQTPHLSKQEQEELKRGMRKHEIEARTLGHPSLGAGAVYEYSESWLICEPLPGVPMYYQQFYGLESRHFHFILIRASVIKVGMQSITVIKHRYVIQNILLISGLMSLAYIQWIWLKRVG